MSNILVQKDDKTICWRMLTMDDEEEVKRLTLQVFALREPLCVSLNITEIPTAKQLLLNSAISCLKQNASIGAYDESNKNRLCGISMMKVSILSELQDGKREAENHLNDAVSLLTLRFLGEAYSSIQKATHDEKFMYIGISTVEEKYCKMGIMTHFRKTAERISREQQCRYLVTFSTSKYTQNISEKLGYKTVKEFKYSEYVDEVTGTKPFAENVPAPHTSARVTRLVIDSVLKH